MPIINKEEILYLGESFQRKIRVLKDGYFHIRLPEVIIEKTGCLPVISSPTKSEAIELWSEKLREYETSQTTTRKVIIYKIDPRVSFSKGITLCLAAAVFIEDKTMLNSMDSAKYSYKYVRGPAEWEESIEDCEQLPKSIASSGGYGLAPSCGRKSVSAIDWTPERHQFFTAMATALEGLRDKLDTLNDDQDTLLRLADAGRKILNLEDVSP